MQLEDYFDFLAPNDIRIAGTRIGIETVLSEFIHRARTPEEIACTYHPSLTLVPRHVHNGVLFASILNLDVPSQPTIISVTGY